MKLLIYSHAFAPRVGGVETLVKSLAQGLAEQAAARGEDLKVTVATATLADSLADHALPFRVVRQPGRWHLMRLLRDADVVHLAGPSFLPLLMALALAKPIVVEHHGFQTVCPNGLLFYEPTGIPCPGHFMAGRHRECLRCNNGQGKWRSLRMWLLTFPRRWLCQRISRNIVPTNWLGGVLKLPRTAAIPHGLSQQPGSAGAATLRSPTTFVFLGRLVSAKGAHILLEATHRLKVKGFDFRVCIVGDGSERRNLEAQAEALGLKDRVAFLGYLPPTALEEAIAQAAAVVMPSLGGEVFGLVAAENMMNGRLLIASDIGALAEVVGDAGLRFPPGDVERLADCMQKVLQSPDLVPELGRKARERAARLFVLAAMVEKHRSIYRELIGERARPC